MTPQKDDLIEFKFRLDTGPNTKINFVKWEDIPATIELEVKSERHFKRFLKTIVGSCTDEVREIRWNFKGSLQGHYVWPERRRWRAS